MNGIFKGFMLLFLVFSFASCGGNTDKNNTPKEDGEVDAIEIERYVLPIAEYMTGNEGTQLFSYFDQQSFKEETTTLIAEAYTTGSSGSDGAIFLTEFNVNGVPFKPFIVVSDQDKRKVKDALKKSEKKNQAESVQIVFSGKLVRDGSMKSPFGGEIKLKFAEGRIITIH